MAQCYSANKQHIQVQHTALRLLNMWFYVGTQHIIIKYHLKLLLVNVPDGVRYNRL